MGRREACKVLRSGVCFDFFYEKPEFPAPREPSPRFVVCPFIIQHSHFIIPDFSSNLYRSSSTVKRFCATAEKTTRSRLLASIDVTIEERSTCRPSHRHDFATKVKDAV